jgi:hypothetical protein
MRNSNYVRSSESYPITEKRIPDENYDTSETTLLDSSPLLKKVVSRQPKASKRAAVRCKNVVTNRRDFDPADYIVLKEVKENE